MVLHLLRKFTLPTETFIVNQINAMPELGPKVFSTRNLLNLRTDAEIICSAETSFLSTKFISPKSLAFFNNKLSNFFPEVIHSHYLTDASYFHPLTRKLKIPKVCSCYGYDVSAFPKKFGWLSKQYFRRVFKEYHYFLAMSEVMKEDLIALGCPGEKVLIHYHGINTGLFDVERTYHNRHVFNLLTIGRLVPMKGHLTVLKALLILKNEISLMQYHIVGDGENREALEKFVRKNGLEGIVFFHKAIKHGSDFNRYLKQADVFLHPSVITSKGAKEGIPGAIVEAMASGLPVVATFHGGIPSVITDYSTGLLVNEHDSLRLAEKIFLLYKDEIFRRLIGINAKKYAQENLDVFFKAKQLHQIYLSLRNGLN